MLSTSSDWTLNPGKWGTFLFWAKHSQRRQGLKLLPSFESLGLRCLPVWKQTQLFFFTRIQPASYSVLIHFIGIIEWKSNYHNLTRSKADPATSHFFLQGSKYVQRARRSHQCHAHHQQPSSALQCLLGQVSGGLGHWVGVLRGFEKKGAKVADAS